MSASIPNTATKVTPAKSNGIKSNGKGKPVAPKPVATQAAPSSPVIIRLAQNEDFPAMMALGRLLHGESGFRALPMDETRMLEIGRRGLKDGNPGLFVAERNGEIVGMAIVVLGEYYFSPIRSATVQLLYVHPDARGSWAAIKLLRVIRKWAKQNQAQDLHVNVTTGIDPARTDRFLRTMGFRQTGGNYVMEGGAVMVMQWEVFEKAQGEGMEPSRRGCV